MPNIQRKLHSNSDTTMKTKPAFKNSAGLALKTGIMLTACLVAGPLAHATISTTTYDHSQYISSGIITQTDPNGKRIQYTYDAVNNLTKMGLLDATGGAVTYDYTYDLTNQLETITYPEGSQIFGYDDLDRLNAITVNEFNTGGPMLAFSYDHQDRITWITYPGNGEVCYQYDPDGRITRVGRFHANTEAQCSAADEKTDYHYDGKGRLDTISYPNGLNQYRHYHSDTGLVKEVGYEYANGTLLYSDRYEYTPFTRLYHQVIRKTAAGSKTTEYGYDAYERVTSVLEADGRTTVFGYDPFGNRLSETITNANGTNATGGHPKAYGEYQYIYPDKSNRLAQINYKAPAATTSTAYETFSYDVAGRITARVNGAGTTSYTFDDRGLMTHANMADGTHITYSYDALGNRRAKTVNGETTHYLTAPIFGMSHVLAELAEDMTIKSTYLYAGPQLLKEEPSTTDRSLDLYMLHEGKVGSITHTVDMNGSVRNEYDYDTFGTRTNVKTANTGSNQHFGYTGEMQDPESGLLYLRARYYDPAIGRFISADPYLGRMAEPVTQNRYIYVHNNPLLYSDPSGNCVGGAACPTNIFEVLVADYLGAFWKDEVEPEIPTRDEVADGLAMAGVGVSGFGAAIPPSPLPQTTAIKLGSTVLGSGLGLTASAVRGDISMSTFIPDLVGLAVPGHAGDIAGFGASLYMTCSGEL